MVAIDKCGPACELLEGGCTQQPTTASPTTASPTTAPPTTAPPTTAQPITAQPSPSCILCTDNATPWMMTQNYECPTAPKWLIVSRLLLCCVFLHHDVNILTLDMLTLSASLQGKKCNKDDNWINNLYCERSCEAAGFGYHTSSCCSSSA